VFRTPSAPTEVFIVPQLGHDCFIPSDFSPIHHSSYIASYTLPFALKPFPTSDEGDRKSIGNIGFYLNHGVADCLT
jgi:hypothetical protein